MVPEVLDLVVIHLHRPPALVHHQLQNRDRSLFASSLSSNATGLFIKAVGSFGLGPDFSRFPISKPVADFSMQARSGVNLGGLEIVLMWVWGWSCRFGSTWVDPASIWADPGSTKSRPESSQVDP